MQQQIIDAVSNSLAVILESNGYSCNFGENVVQWGETKRTENDLDIIDVREDGDISVDSESIDGMFLCVLPLCIEAITEGKGVDKVLRIIIKDIYKALGVDKSFGGIVDKLVAKSHTIEIEQHGKRVGAARVNVEIHYMTQSWE